MEIRKVLALRGPNIWANFPALEAWVDLKELEDSPSDTIPGFNERLMSWLPTMVEHRCSIGERGGFFERLRRGTWMGHILEHTTLELQSLAGTPVGFGRARETSERGVYKVAIEYQEESVGRECLATAHRLLMCAIKDEPFDIVEEIARLREMTQDVCLGPSTKAIVEAAQRRGIPYRRLNEESLIQFGHGVHQRRIRAAETDRTSAIAESIAQDKELTRKLLKEVGVPVPEGEPVKSADEAWTAAKEIGVPVVVKPQDGNQGRGVALNLTTEEQVRAAYLAAHEESAHVLVEKYHPGADYRLLVIDGKLVAAARREPAQVVGDGAHSIEELVDIANTDPRRGEHHATVLSKLKLDAVSLAVLTEQGFGPTSVPAPQQRVLIRRNANLSTGGSAEDITSEVHPDVAARAVEAAKIVGLDICGIDIVATCVTSPLEETGGVIVEVNAAPGLRMHVSPSSGTPQPVGDAIVNMLYPQVGNGRVPIVAITGVNGKTTTTRFIAHILRGTNKCVGFTSTDGVQVGDRRVDTGDCSGPKSARAILANPQVEMAVFETARGGILREGLGFDHCDVAVVTNIGEGDHLGLADINDLETLAKVKRCIVDVVPPTGFAVLNAADPHVVPMAAKCPGGVVWFARTGDLPVIIEHRAKGGRAVFTRDNYVILATGDHEFKVVSLDKVPLTLSGQIGFQVENTLASIAAAWALGIPAELIRLRAESFAPNMELNPGRFNVLTIHETTVVIDYGHNVSALVALVDAIKGFPQLKRAIVYSTAGDRRDEDLIRQGEILGNHFDKVFLYEGDYVRGREVGEITKLISQGLAKGTRVKEVFDIKGAIKATEMALGNLDSEELMVVQADVVDDTVDFLRDRYGWTIPKSTVKKS